MRIKLAKTAGFCMGVRHALELALGSLRRHPRPIYTYGPLIHNPQVLNMLSQHGIKALDHIPAHVDGGTVIIRAHGVPPEVKEKLKECGFEKVIDGTCSRVIKVQAIIRRAARRGSTVVIVGDADHPEVVGLLAHAGEHGLVVSALEQTKNLSLASDRLTVVAQTTQNQEFYDQVCGELAGHCREIEVFQTICQATQQRQSEVMQLARETEAVVVVGGRQSANSLRLATLARESGGRAYLVEDEKDIDQAELSRFASIGVTAGASTPNWMIKRVTRHIKDFPVPGRNRMLGFLLRVFPFVGRSQLLTGMSAAMLCVAAGCMQLLAFNWQMPVVAFGFVMAMHLINNLLESTSDQYNDPEQTRFLAKYSNILWGMGIGGGLAALVMAALWGGILPFALLLIMTISGVFYSLPIMPGFIQKRFYINRLRDIPGSKTIALVLAWGAVTVFLPALVHQVSINTFLAALYVMGLIFIKNSMLDAVGVQGDLFVGKETLPMVWGRQKTRRVLNTAGAGLAVLLAVVPWAGVWPWALSLVLAFPLLALAVMQYRFFNKSMFPELGAQSLLEMSLMLGALCVFF